MNLRSYLTHFSKVNEKEHWLLGNWYLGMGYFLYRQVEMDKAEEYHKKAINFFKLKGDSKRLFTTYCYLSTLKAYEKDIAEALEYNNLAEDILKLLKKSCCNRVEWLEVFGSEGKFFLNFLA